MNARLIAALAGLSAIASALLIAAIFLVFRDGGVLVLAQDNTVGEMLLDEGLRLEANGDFEDARAKYSLAERARFEGTKNLRHLQLKLAEHGEASGSRIHHYREAVQDTALAQKDPSLWRTAWDSLCTELARAEQWQELEAALATWDATIARAGRFDLYVSSHDGIRDAASRDYFHGLLALNKGDKTGAMERFRLACVDGYGPPRGALADLMEQSGMGNREVIQRLRDDAQAYMGDDRR